MTWNRYRAKIFAHISKHPNKHHHYFRYIDKYTVVTFVWHRLSAVEKWNTVREQRDKSAKIGWKERDFSLKLKPNPHQKTHPTHNTTTVCERQPNCCQRQTPNMRWFIKGEGKEAKKKWNDFINFTTSPHNAKKSSESELIRRERERENVIN